MDAKARNIDLLIQALQPNMEDYSDNAKFHYWMDYACELDEFSLLNYKGEGLVERLNQQMKKLSLTAEHHAATDLATSIESMIPEYKGVFVYE